MSKTNGFASFRKIEKEGQKKFNSTLNLLEPKAPEDLKARTNEDFFNYKRNQKRGENLKDISVTESNIILESDKLILPKTDQDKPEIPAFKLLYKRKAFINNLALVDVRFFLYSKKYFLLIQNVYFG